MVRVITDYLDTIVKRYPEKKAYVDTNRSITFLQLFKESNKVASYLANRCIEKKPILVFMDKSVSCISCFFGIARSGNYYSPIDIKMPQARIEKIISTLKPAMVITDEKHIEYVRRFSNSIEVSSFETIIEKTIEDESLIKKIRQRMIDTDVLYVLFTSGSTGIPKGVIINHRAVIDFIEWISECYGFDETTVFANQAQLYFDLSIQDVFAPVRNGSTTVLIPNRFFATPVRVWKMLIENKVDTLVWIPSVLTMFANLELLENMERLHLKNVLFCGEVMPTKQLNYWIKQYPNVTYANLYGPTECTEACTYYTINRQFEDNEVLPIGIPCENTGAIVIDEEGEIIDRPDEVGELCIRGTSLSMGYYGNKEKTDEVFVQDPSQSDYPELVYKTGDLVKYNNLHELVYVSRKDFQIKKRGFRVELGEIEAVFSSVEGVEYCCCLFNTDDEKIVLVYSGNASEDELKIKAKNFLQEYMYPDEYVNCGNMVFNLNGKIDRKTLQERYIG